MSLYEQVVEAHRKSLDRLVERGTVERLRSVYERAANEVLAKLERIGRGSQTFTAHHLRLTLAQLKAGQIVIDEAMVGELGAASREAQADSLHGLIRDFKKLERHFTGHAPVLPIEEAARFAGVIDKRRTSLLKQHKTSVKRYGHEVIGRVQEELSISLAAGENLDNAIKRVHGAVNGEFWQAERIARTEVAWASNQTHSDGIAELAKEDEEIYSQWIEFCGPDGRPLDERVDVDSIAMHGQLVRPGQLFTMPARAPFPNAKGKTDVPDNLVGKSWAAPPCRPNGRETVQVWKRSWGSPGWVYQNGSRRWLVRP